MNTSSQPHSSAIGGSITTLARHIRDRTRTARQRRTLRSVSGRSGLRIIVGAGGRAPSGWVATDQPTLDLLREDDWDRWFVPGSIDRILAEHVWEHLTPEDGARAAALCLRYLSPGGMLRIAVPDGLHPDPDYVEAVRPGGSGPGADDHHVLYDAVSLSWMLNRVGFAPRVVEHHDRRGRFHREPWDASDGVVMRSSRFDRRNRGGRMRYTSLIVDGYKPIAG